MTQKLADRIKLHLEKGKTQTATAKRFKVQPNVISWLKASKFDAEIYHEYKKEITRRGNVRRYQKKQKDTYEQVMEKLNKMGFNSYSEAISEMGLEPFKANLRQWNIKSPQAKQGVIKTKQS